MDIYGLGSKFQVGYVSGGGPCDFGHWELVWKGQCEGQGKDPKIVCTIPNSGLTDPNGFPSKDSIDAHFDELHKLMYEAVGSVRKP